ncbi:MAG: flavodoxin family protein [Chloroflexi bacterium]|nr:flavodoxin family protein [Chloroflexota bacterium]
MKGIIIYDSSYGNTRKIAETIAETLEESGIEADVCHVKKAKKLSATWEELRDGLTCRIGRLISA